MIPDSQEERIGLFRNCVRSIVEGHSTAEAAKRKIDAINLLWASEFDDKGKGPPLTYNGEPAGLFTIVGYQVGNKTFAADKRRVSDDEHDMRPYLAYIIDGVLPHIQSDEYMKTWGEAGSRQRIETAANKIKTLADRGRNRPGFGLALSHWDADVEYLRQRGKNAPA